MYLGGDGLTYYQFNQVASTINSISVSFGPLTFNFQGPSGSYYTSPAVWQGNAPSGFSVVEGWLSEGWIPTSSKTAPTGNCKTFV